MKRRNRAVASEEKVKIEASKNKERIANKRKNQSQLERDLDTAKSKDCMVKMRASQSTESKEREASMNRERIATKRKNQLQLKKDEDNAKSKDFMAKMRATQSKESKEIYVRVQKFLLQKEQICSHLEFQFFVLVCARPDTF